MKTTIPTLAVLALAFAGLTGSNQAQETKTVSDINIIVKTNKGSIEGVIYASKTPLNAANFLNLPSNSVVEMGSKIEI